MSITKQEVNLIERSTAPIYMSRPLLATVGVCVLFAFINWVAHFWFNGDFGFYQDDHYRIPHGMNMESSDFWNWIKETSFLNQGRPLHNFFTVAFAFWSSKIYGLQGIYWLGFVISTLNVCLLYFLLQRLSRLHLFSIIGGLVFCLFPADTNHAWITHSFGIKPSLTLILIALHCYLSDRKFSSYVLAATSLLWYETVFPLFLVAPLMRYKWDEAIAKKLFQHAFVLATILVSIYLIRLGIGESRSLNTSMVSLLLIAVRNMLVGPLVVMGNYVYRPIEVAFELNPMILAVTVVSFISLASFFLVNMAPTSRRINPKIPSAGLRAFWAGLPDEYQKLVKVMVIGLAMLMLAYPLTFIGSPLRLHTHWTRIHFAASVGSSIIFASVVSLCVNYAYVYGRERVVVIVIAAYLSILVVFGLIVQEDYRQNWEYQKTFLRNVLELAPDINDGTAILIGEDSVNYRSKHAGTFGRALPKVLQNMYEFPSNWSSPGIYRLKDGWREQIISNNNLFKLDRGTTLDSGGFYRDVATSNTILLETNQGILKRSNSGIVIFNQTYNLKKPPKVPANQYYKKTNAFDVYTDK